MTETAASHKPAMALLERLANLQRLSLRGAELLRVRTDSADEAPAPGRTRSALLAEAQREPEETPDTAFCSSLDGLSALAGSGFREAAPRAEPPTPLQRGDAQVRAALERLRLLSEEVRARRGGSSS
jgi:hypothetical protein